MPKQTTVVEFEDKEIRDILLAKAKDSLGKTIQGIAEIVFTTELSAARDGSAGSKTFVNCKVTFNGKADK